MRYRNDPDGTRLPIKLDTTTNGEFAPIPLEPVHRHARALAHRGRDARTRGALALSRRDFLVSACGAASTLLAMNARVRGARAARRLLRARRRGRARPAARALDARQRRIHLRRAGPLREPDRRVDASRCRRARSRCASRANAELRARRRRRARVPAVPRPATSSSRTCSSIPTPTSCVLSFVPSTREGEPLTIEEAAATARDRRAAWRARTALLLHGRVNPNQAGDVEAMDVLAEQLQGRGVEDLHAVGAGRRGLLPRRRRRASRSSRRRASSACATSPCTRACRSASAVYEHSTCVDVGRVAKRFPDVNFLIYHSGFVAGQPEGPYDASAHRRHRRAGARACVENGVKPGSNVYAELGSTWRFLMRDPDAAAHVLGKLLKYVGEDNVLWGTDSIWYGSPQDQIQAFRTFQIARRARASSTAIPKITPALRAKVFGRNALRDLPGARRRAAQAPAARPRRAEREDYRERARSRRSSPTGRRRGASSSTLQGVGWVAKVRTRH